MASKSSRSKTAIDGFSKSIQKKAKSLGNELLAPALRVPSLSDFLPSKDDRILAMTRDQKILARGLIQDVIGSVPLHHLAAANASPRWVSEFFGSVAIDVVSALERFEVLAEKNNLNPLREKDDDAKEIIKKTTALLRVFPKPSERREKLSLLATEKKSSKIFDELDKNLSILRSGLQKSLPSLRERRESRSRKTLQFALIRDIDWLASLYFGKRLKDRDAFVVGILRLESLSFVADYDPATIGRPTARNLRRWKTAAKKGVSAN